MNRRIFGAMDLDLIEQLFERLPENPFFMKDSELRYIAANAAMVRLCGLQEVGELFGRTAGDVFPRRLADRYEALDRQILDGGMPIRDRLELSAGLHGTAAWLLFSRFPVQDMSGMVIGIAATSRQLPAPDRHHPTYERVAAVVRQIRENFDAPLRPGDFGSLTGVSKSQLERDFLRLFGVTMRSFLHSIRIEHAIRRLAGSASITRIAMECGYSDHSAFTRRFRKIVGLSPREYRRRLGSPGGAE